MKKILFFAFFIFFFLFCSSKSAMAVYVNWLQEDFAEQYTETHTGYISGTPSNVGDNDLNSSFSAMNSCGPNQRPVIGGIADVVTTFSSSNIKIDKTEFTFETMLSVSGQSVHRYYVKIYNGNWYTVSSGEQSDNFGKQTITANFSEYSNVSKIEVFVYAMGATAWLPGYGSATAYEIKAWGNKYADIGLRAYDGTGIIKVACEPAGILSSPLRICKNGTTYAVALVEPADYRASKIRIRTSSGVKALVKLD